MSKEHEEFLQAKKDNLLDTGIAFSNGVWCLSGVFNGKLDWMDLPNADGRQPLTKEETEALLGEFINELGEPDEGVWTDGTDETFPGDDLTEW